VCVVLCACIDLSVFVFYNGRMSVQC